MRIVIFCSSGMVGQGALRECLGDREVGQVLSVVRAPSETTQEKLREIVQNNFLNFTPIENDLTGLDACLYCPGVTSTGTSEENYTRITYEFTIAAASTLLKLNPRPYKIRRACGRQHKIVDGRRECVASPSRA